MPESAVVLSTNDLNHEEWLQARTHGIGGSDAGVILGVNKWKTPFELWLEKTGQVDPESSTNEAAYFGTLLEDLVAKEFELRAGKKVRRRNAILKHPEHDFIRANIDRLVVGEKAVLECKTASAYLMKEWENDEVPASYLVQMQHYLGVLGSEYKKGYFAVLIGGQKFIWKEIERDDELINMIFQAEIDFWEKHVLANVPPALDGSSAAEQFLKERYAETDPDKSIDLKYEYKDKIEQYLSLKDTIKELEGQAKALENDIKNELKEAETGFVGPYQATWKPITSNRVDTKQLKSKFPDIYEQVLITSTYRKFGIKKIG
jgi:putative phage-type endonuclease